MRTAADDVSFGSLKYAMAADLAQSRGFGGKNGAEEIVQPATFALLLIYIMERDVTVTANHRCFRVSAFAHQWALHGFEREILDFANHLMILWDVVMQQL